MYLVIVSCAALALLLLAVWPFYTERSRKVIGPDARHGAEGEFALLSQGVTHFRWVGSVRGPVAVVIPGLTTSMVAMEAVGKALGDDGYRVLMYDLYGRGLSDAPHGIQNRAFFLRQLSDLLALHHLKEDITLAGYSMGGAIATAFAADNPNMTKQVVLIAPSGVVRRDSTFDWFCSKVPLIGTWAHAMFAERWFKGQIPRHGETRAIDKVLRAQRRQLDRRGFLPSILASRRGILAEVQEREHRQLGRQGIQVIAVWARKDTIIPMQAVGKLAEWNRSAYQEVVDKADHTLPYTQSDRLIAALRATLHPLRE